MYFSDKIKINKHLKDVRLYMLRVWEKIKMLQEDEEKAFFFLGSF
jgi:hypothetical protein